MQCLSNYMVSVNAGIVQKQTLFQLVDKLCTHDRHGEKRIRGSKLKQLPGS